jgi:hypothetical protein
MTPSVIPSLKYSASASMPPLLKGSTATDSMGSWCRGETLSEGKIGATKRYPRPSNVSTYLELSAESPSAVLSLFTAALRP